MLLIHMIENAKVSPPRSNRYGFEFSTNHCNNDNSNLFFSMSCGNCRGHENIKEYWQRPRKGKPNCAELQKPTEWRRKTVPGIVDRLSKCTGIQIPLGAGDDYRVVVKSSLLC